METNTIKICPIILKAVSCATSSDETRPTLHGVHVKKLIDSDKVTYEATNGNQMIRMVYTLTPEEVAEWGRFEAEFIIPAHKIDKVYKEYKELIGRSLPHLCKVSMTRQKLTIELTEDESMGFAIIDGTFPDLDRVIPQNEFPIDEIGLDLSMLKNFADSLKVLGQKSCQAIFTFTQANSPIKLKPVHYKELNATWLGVMMPVRNIS